MVASNPNKEAMNISASEISKHVAQECAKLGFLDADGRPTEEFREALKKVYVYVFSRTPSWNNSLMDCIASASIYEREKLRLGFPLEVAAFDFWFFTPKVSDDVWFRALDVLRAGND